MKVALAQMQMTTSIRDNYEKSLLFLAQAAREGADLVLFPEVQLSPFFPQYKKDDPAGFGAAEEYLLPEDSEYLQGFRNACQENGIHAAINLYTEEKGKKYDLSTLIDDEGNIVGTQKMVHVANAPGFYEQDYYNAGPLQYNVFDTKLGKIGIVVCFDRHFPESVRWEAEDGAQLILIPTANVTTEPLSDFQWEVKALAERNSVNIAMCNRVGVEGDAVFAGESVVVKYDGTTVAMAPSAIAKVYDEETGEYVERESVPASAAYPFQKPGSVLSSGYVEEEEVPEETAGEFSAAEQVATPSLDPRAVAPSAPPVSAEPVNRPEHILSVFDAETVVLADIDIAGAELARSANPLF